MDCSCLHLDGTFWRAAQHRKVWHDEVLTKIKHLFFLILLSKQCDDGIYRLKTNILRSNPQKQFDRLNCRTINRMSSSSLNNKIPYSIVFPNNLFFPFLLKYLAVFCSWYVSKFAQTFRLSNQMCLLRIFSSSKRVSSYSPNTKKYYKFASVTYFEETLYSLPLHKM